MRQYLIVDDNRAFADNLADIVRDYDGEATIAASADEALAIAAKKTFDALVTDMRMPVVGGAELVHRLRKSDPGLPAIVVTAYTSDDNLEAAREQGLLAVLPKPVPVDRLIQLLGIARRDALVALVEDDAALADNLSEALRDRGFSTVTASSVIDAEQMKSVRPFVGIVDMRLPGGKDGDAMLRLAARFPALPMIVVTAYPDAKPPLAAEGFFPKPFSTAVLIEAIEAQYAAKRKP